jgi:hypothetical protein
MLTDFGNSTLEDSKVCFTKTDPLGFSVPWTVGLHDTSAYPITNISSRFRLLNCCVDLPDTPKKGMSMRSQWLAIGFLNHMHQFRLTD